MLIDRRTLLQDDVTPLTTSVLSQTLDLTVGGFHGTGNPLYFCVAVNAVAAGADHTYTIKIEDGTAVDGNGNISAGKADIPNTHLTFDQAKVTDFKWAVIPASESLNRYVQAWAAIGGTNPSWKVNAWIQGERPEHAPVYAGNPQRRITRDPNMRVP